MSNPKFYKLSTDFIASGIGPSEVDVHMYDYPYPWSTLKFYRHGKLVHVREDTDCALFEWLDENGFTDDVCHVNIH